MAEETTDRQREILQAVKNHLRKHCVPPTVREICAVVGITSPNGVLAHLTALSKKGEIEWIRGGKSRGIWPTKWKKKVERALASAI